MSETVTDTERQSTDDATAKVPIWKPLIDRVRGALADGDTAGLIALDGELEAMMARPHREVRRGMPLMAVYRSLIAWKRDGRFVTPFEDSNSAKIQFWELDEHLTELDYKRRFVDHAIEQFPTRRGFRLFHRVLSTISESRSTFKVANVDIQIHRRPGAKLTILGFSAIKGGFAGVGWMLFDRAVAEPLDANLIIVKDVSRRIYLSGIQSLGDYAASVAGMRELLAEFADTRIVATGASGGVFGAINFAADLGVRHIVAFAGPTSIEVGEENPDRQIYRSITADIEAGRIQRVDLASKVNDSAIERIDFFVAGQSKFDMAQMEALRSRCEKVVPHVYEELSGHIVADYAIEDRSIFTAFEAGSKETGLA